MDNVTKLQEIVKEKQRESYEETLKNVKCKNNFDFPPTKITVHKSLSKKPNGKHKIVKYGWETVDVTSIRELFSYIIHPHYCWCPGIYTGRRRLQEDFISAELAVLDCDGSITLNQATDWANERELFYILAPTLNHQKTVSQEKPACDRFRFIMRFFKPVTDINEYRHNINLLIATINSDESCKDGARYYEPSASIFVAEDGNFLDIEPKKSLPTDAVKNQQLINKLMVSKEPRNYILKWIHGEEKIEPGTRHVRCFAIASELFRCGFDSDEIKQIINDIPFNKNASGAFKPFGEDDLKRIIENSYSIVLKELGHDGRT